MANYEEIVRQSVSRPPISIGRRMCLCFAFTIFGLLFFYLFMVYLSTIATNITLERLEPNGWPRSASRHTAAVTAPVFSFFLLSAPSSLWSLFWAVMAACAQFCHFVILSSDLSIYVDEEVAVRVFRTDLMHPIFRRLPLYFPHVVGTIGFICFLVLTTERCFGPAMRHRRPCLPWPSVVAASWIFMVFSLWFLDHLVNAFHVGRPAKDIMYPISFLLPLLFGHAVMLLRCKHDYAIRALQRKADEQKKDN